MIAAHRLSKKFGNFLAVDSVDFEIPRGRVVGFLGPNGAGKTTTIRMIAGFLPPTAGSVTVDGLDVTRRSLEVRRRLGYLPESAPLYAEMRVREFLAFRARLFGLDRAQRRVAIGRVLEQCGLEAVERRPIHHLSKGYRQRVGLAAALVHDPPVLILDEPTAGLDPTQIRLVRGLIRELAGERTILLSSHILPEVELICDRLIMIARGRIRAAGTIESLRELDARHRRYVLEASGEGAAAALEPVAGVADVQRVPLDGPWQRLIVTSRSSAADLREDLAAALAAAGCAVREIRPDLPSLEHLFVRMVADAETDFVRRAGAARAPSAAARGPEVTV